MLPFVTRVGEAAPRCPHGERCDAREVALGITGIVELRDRVLHFGLTRHTEVERRQHLAGHAQGVRLGQDGGARVMLQFQLPRLVLLRTNQLGRAEVGVPHDDRIAVLVVRAEEHAAAAAERAHPQHRIVTETDGGRVAHERGRRGARDEVRTADEETRLLLAFDPEPRQPSAVPPRRDLRQQRRADANELESAAELRQADVVGRHPEARAAEAALALVDRLPALLERRQVPSPTARAHDPQAPLPRIEREPPPDGERREEVVRAQVRVAEEAGGVHLDWLLAIRYWLLAFGQEAVPL
jgi:hypothetical protein